MARECFCGCGRRLGFWNARIAKNGALVQRKLDELEAVVDATAEGPAGFDNYAEFVAVGHQHPLGRHGR